MSSTGAKSIHALLDSLREAARDLAEREERLNQGFYAEQAKLRQRLKDARADHEGWYAAELAGADAAVAAANEKVEQADARNRARANRVGGVTRQQRIAELENDEGRQKFEVQRDILQISRDQEINLKNVETTRQNFIAELAAENAALRALEHKAKRAFRPYKKYVQMFTTLPEGEGVDVSRDENQLLEDFRAFLAKTRHQVNHAAFSPVLFLFGWFPLWLLVPLILAVIGTMVPAFHPFKWGPISYGHATVIAAVSIAFVVALYFMGRQLSAPAAMGIVTSLARGRRFLSVCEEKSLARHRADLVRVRREAEDRTLESNERWNQVSREAAQARADWGMQIDARVMRVFSKSDAFRQKKLHRLEDDHGAKTAQLRRLLEIRLKETESASAANLERLETDNASRWLAMISEWTERLQHFNRTVSELQDFGAKHFPEWTPQLCRDWTPPQAFAHAARFGVMEVETSKLLSARPQDARLAFTGLDQYHLPLLLSLPEEGAILFETKTAGRDKVVAALNDIILRLLSVAPPGRVKFTILDPAELGQNFAGIMHLADYEDKLISNRIWTQTSQIEQQLADLNEHIEKVTQMYLRNEYATITEYNEKAGRIAEKYHFLVVADFPVNFSEVAVKRLMSIAASGPRCGVYTLLHWDQRRAAPSELVPEVLRNNSIWIQARNDGFVISDKRIEGTDITLDAPPDSDSATELLQRVGKASIDSNRVEMPFEEVAPPADALWTGDTTSELRVPIGRTGATKLQYLALGKGTRQHVLVAGKTGSGKSTLFHVMITNLALWCSPEQVEFYLVDFKKGVEFKAYATARLPHARVVAIESDREFGLSVLQRVDEELKRRGDLFRDRGVQDIAGYKKAGGKEPIPRTLLLIDEFQEFFVEDDRVSQSANLLLDRLVRQGRAFGIHVLLGSQTLGGAYTLARPTLGQMVVRIALQCNEADAYLIMDETNPAPRLLSRPGEAIYNDAAGSIEGNSPFQIVWLPDEVREAWLAKARRKADEAGNNHPGPIVFEGNAPADINENLALNNLLNAPAVQPVISARAWLGAPNSIKGPTEVVFHHQSGGNLLIVGQREEATLAMIAISLISLAAQHPRGTARFVIFDGSQPGSRYREFLEKVVRIIPHETILATNAEAESTMTGLTAELEKQIEAGQAGATSTYVFINGIHRFKKLRYDEDLEFSVDASKAAHPAAQLNRLATEGPGLGFHVICACDNVNNVNRYLSRKALGEFDLRVLFQMSANDSAILIDSPKAGNLGLHRAIYYNEQEGYTETFRPYALPADAWIEETGQKLARLLA